ncbi:DUF4192 domain-containing protein [Nonomuraea sp. NBC_00507]|uniref:DUF4192 family protein n=1 Tax=Nonomuraea sp. NBC_00507 TaxID=2976002 RepID=UPI002E16F5A0
MQAEPAAMTTMLLDVARRTQPAFLAPVGSLRALAAWCQGELDVANRAVAEVLAVSPFYSMAQLLKLALHVGAHPETLRVRLPMPAELDLFMGPPRQGPELLKLRRAAK